MGGRCVIIFPVVNSAELVAVLAPRLSPVRVQVYPGVGLYDNGPRRVVRIRRQSESTGDRGKRSEIVVRWIERKIDVEPLRYRIIGTFYVEVHDTNSCTFFNAPSTFCGNKVYRFRRVFEANDL